MLGEKVVLQFNNGNLLKGYIKGFSHDSDGLLFEELGKNDVQEISVQELKAIFFVKTFEGDSKYREKKRYGLERPELARTEKEGRKIFVRFKDGESMVGYLHGDVPWEKGFFLSKPDIKKAGFFLVPVDEESNNIKVFVVRSSIKDVTAFS